MPVELLVSRLSGEGLFNERPKTQTRVWDVFVFGPCWLCGVTSKPREAPWSEPALPDLGSTGSAASPESGVLRGYNVAWQWQIHGYRRKRARHKGMGRQSTAQGNLAPPG